MNTHTNATVTLLTALLLSISAHANTLGPDAVLQRGQSIQSLNHAYRLTMQTDGSLVMYRRDGTKRYGMAKNGEFAIMQSDGNFVEYSKFATALWNTGTHGNPNSYLAVQDDGNLVVYGSRGAPLWNIGAEPSPDDPSQVADVVGRDLNVPGLGWIGHLGIWDGANVLEATPAEHNAIRMRSINNFKNDSTYWGKATWKLPNEQIYALCYGNYCPDYGGREFLPARLAAARRAYQIYLIGADYTATVTGTVPAHYATERQPARRGIYRCDTFVLDALRYSTFYSAAITGARLKWYNQYHSLDNDGILPRLVFDKLKTFN